ncbi:DNA-directed RNA polymerase subunit beta' [Candidatus Uhrbacteria bacterium]|nr:DNA-directed RNA polymerase subunit beta' [Candidatus Uhrbacteria bacterium]
MPEFNREAPVIDFDAIRLRLASPEVIHAWSYGEVTKPETINYRTHKPEKDGLFDERIFGPTKDWECYCGKYKKIRYKGIVCDKCGVEVTHSLVRRERMGHIDLAAPTSHIWFLRGVPSKIGLALDLSVQSLEKIIYFANFVITRVDEAAKAEAHEAIREEFAQKKKAIEGEYKREIERLEAKGAKETEKEKAGKLRDSKIKELTEDFEAADKELKEIVPLAIISENAYQEYSLRYGHIFDAGIGAEAVRALLSRIDVPKTIAGLEAELKESRGGAKSERIVRRLKLLKSLHANGLRPDFMILTAVPVIPPDLRPMVPLDGGRFATSDLNDLYRRIINRNNRLKRLVELNAPEVISRNEKRMLQEACDALIDNSARQAKTVVAPAGKKRQLKSLADILKGKQGRFRQNLLGKRIDYSGRSVIVVGPNLKLHQCGLPKRMALELFRPFVISRLIAAGLVHNIRSANRFIELDKSEVWDMLEDITKGAHVLLNRAPTLHRLGIQAFQPILIEGKAIQIHPMVCTAYNADFDGDQMAVHVPLTEEAKREAAERMLSVRNLLKPATGSPVATPNKDVAWGCYYMTLATGAEKKDKKAFASPEEAIYAYETKHLSLHELIRVRLREAHEAGLFETTVGRIVFNRVLPDEIPYVNEVTDTKRLGEIIRLSLEIFGNDITARLLDDIKAIGFKYATRSGYSWGMGDLPDLPEKSALIDEGNRQIDLVEEQFSEGLLTASERHAKIIETWTEIKDRITKLSKSKLDPASSVASMINSGARGSLGQLTQMMAMKGLVTNPAGDIIELPVKAGFREGLDVLEYFISTHGTRKGLSDTALRTANAGYLTRRLVDVAQDVIVSENDCGDSEGMQIGLEESEEMGETVAHRALGRYLLADIKDPKTGRIFAKADTLITEKIAREIEKREIIEVRVRSVLHCRLRKGTCQKCYGYDLAYNKPVEIGTAVGIVAAQSIGEPGTQLTMRTFHTGGVAGLDITQGLPRVEELFEARPPKRRAFISDTAGAVLIEEGGRETVDASGKKVAIPPGHRVIRVVGKGVEEDVYKLGRGEKPKMDDGAPVAVGDVLFVKKNNIEVKAEHNGTVSLDGKTLKVIWEGPKVKEFLIPPGYVLWVKPGDLVAPGTQLTEGDIDLQELYALSGKAAVKRYILREIQSIYSSQGQKLNDKHIEVIVKQMFSRVLVRDAGDTNLLPSEIAEKAEFEAENEMSRKGKKKEATADELLLGISRVALSTQSFLSAASFQETAKVLINAAVTGKVDRLEGLKENVIIGRLIPAGSGFGVER